LDVISLADFRKSSKFGTSRRGIFSVACAVALAFAGAGCAVKGKGEAVPVGFDPSEPTFAERTIEIVSGDAQSGSGGVALPAPIVVRMLDKHGDPVEGAPVAFVPLSGSASPSTATTDASGLAQTTWTLGGTAGAQSLVVGRDGIPLPGSSPTVTFGATASSGSASKLAFQTQPSSTGTAGASLSISPVVSVTDSFGNVVTGGGYPITLAAFTDSSCTTPATGTFSAATNPVTSSSGLASFSAVQYTKAQTIYIGASAISLASACSSAVSISAASAATLAWSVNPSSTAVAATALSTQPAVEALDAYGNRATGFASAVTLAAYTNSGCSAAAGGTLAATTNPLSASAGLATFAGVSYSLAGTVYLGASASGLTAICSPAISVSTGPAAKLAFSTQPSSTATAGTAFATQPVVQVQDAGGNLVSSATSSITLAAFTDSGCTVGATGTLGATTNPLSASSGVATFANVSFTKAGTIYLKASTSGGLTAACSSAISVSAGSASKLAFSTQPSATATASTNFATQPVVSVTDTYGNVVSSATDSITLGAYSNATCTSGAGGSLSATTNPLSAVSGVATFAGVRYSGSGTIYLKASAASRTAACSTAIVVSAGTATKLAFSTTPSTSGVAGTALAVQPVVQVQDASSNVVTTATNSVTLAAFTNASCTIAATGTLAATTNPLAASAGVATFGGVSYTKAESVYLQAAATGLTSACFGPIAISAGSATTLGFTTQPASTAIAGAILSTPPAVTATDSYGNVVSSPTVPVTISAYTDSGCSTTPASGTLSASTNPVTTSSGVATFASVTYTKAETIYLKATSGVLTAACSSAIAVSPASASALSYTTQPSATAVAGASLSTSPVVTVVDAYGNTVVSSGASVFLAAYTDSACTATAGTGTLAAATNPLGATSGVATFSSVSYTKAETIYLKATSTGLTFACSGAIAVSPGAAATLSFSTQPSTTATLSVNFATQPVVELLDAYGNRATGSSTSVTIGAFTNAGCSTPAGGTLSATTNPVTPASGLAAFAGMKYSQVATIYLGATGSGLTGACSNAVAVAAGTPIQLAFTTQPSATGAAGTALSIQPVVAVQDAGGNTVATATNPITLAAYTDATCATPASGTFSATTNPLSASSGVATFAGVTYTKAESIYLKASTTGGLTSACSAAVAISAGSPSVLVFTTQPSSTGTAGTAFAAQPVVTVRDAYGNTATTSSDSVTLAAFTNATCTVSASGSLTATVNPLAASAGVATFAGTSYAGVGTIYIGASASGRTSACSSAVAVSAGPAVKLAFSTQPSATGTAGTALSTQPVVQVQDAGSFVVTGSSASITLAAFTDATCSTPALGLFSATTNPLSASSGVATFAGVAYTKAETIYLQASSGALTSACSSAVAVSAATASRLGFSTQPSSTGTAGTALATQPTVRVEDTYGNLITAGAYAITLAAYTDSGCSTTPAAGTFSATTNPVTSASGSSTFAGVAYTKAETIYLKASTTGGITAGCSTSVAIAAGAASKLAWTTAASTLNRPNVAIGTQPAVDVQDSYGNRVTGSTASVTLAAYTDSGCTSAATGTLTVTTNPLSATSGLSTFSGVQYSRGEQIYLGAASAGLTSACSALLTFGVDLEVPIELVDSGVQSTTSAVTWERTRTTVTPSLYDGSPTYAFEAVCKNTNATTAYSVSIVNTGGTAEASLSVPANTTNPTRIAATFTPGTPTNYRVKTPATAVAGQITCYAARVRVRQTYATKTQLYIPLTGNDSTFSDADNTVSGGVVDSTGSASATQATPAHYGVWAKDSTKISGLAATNPWTFEAIVAASGTGKIGLYSTGGTLVTGVEHVTTATSPTLMSVSFADTAIADGSYEVRMKRSGGGSTAILFKAAVYVTLSNIVKTQSFYRVGMSSTSNSNLLVEGQRTTIDTGVFSSPTVTFEGTGYKSGTATADLYTAGVNDSGSTGSLVASSSLTFGATKGRVASGSLSLTNGDRFVPRLTLGASSSISLIQPFVVLGAQ
jgi:hypothetical protein